MSLSSALEKLATFRTNNSRASQETFKVGAIFRHGTLIQNRLQNASVILKSAKQLGDDGAACGPLICSIFIGLRLGGLGAAFSCIG
jgi:hypothetical protein